MIGAIIGDLAAWTYEHDRTCFWSHLVSEEVKVSEFGLSVLTTASLISTERSMSKEQAASFTQQGFLNYSTSAVELSPDACQLADRIGTKKAYISKVENGHIDIQLSTLFRIFAGLGKRVFLTIM